MSRYAVEKIWACPDCGGTRLWMSVTAFMTAVVDGETQDYDITGGIEDSALSDDGDSYCQCTRCKFSGEVHDFRVSEQPEDCPYRKQNAATESPVDYTKQDEGGVV